MTIRATHSAAHNRLSDNLSQGISALQGVGKFEVNR
jgi:hypothetical protein